MKKYSIPILCVIFIIVTFKILVHTDKENVTEIQEDEPQKKHVLAFAITHTNIGTGIKNDIGDQWIASPSFAMHYSYAINNKWEIGLHSDIILEEFIVEDKRNNDDEEPEIIGIERSKPITVALMLGYKVYEHIVLIAGGGKEFAKGGNFNVVRFGLDAPFEINNNWEIFGTLTYDIKIDAYDGINFGLGIARLF